MSEDIEELEVPEGVQYGENDIQKVFLNKDLKRLLINYESKRYGFEQIVVPVFWNGEQWALRRVPVGLVPPEEAEKLDSPGANESERMYNMMEEYWNVKVYGE